MSLLPYDAESPAQADEEATKAAAASTSSLHVTGNGIKRSAEDGGGGQCVNTPTSTEAPLVAPMPFFRIDFAQKLVTLRSDAGALGCGVQLEPSVPVTALDSTSRVTTANVTRLSKAMAENERELLPIASLSVSTWTNNYIQKSDGGRTISVGTYISWKHDGCFFAECSFAQVLERVAAFNILCSSPKAHVRVGLRLPHADAAAHNKHYTHAALGSI
jgi:hypothetical protein